MNKNLKPDNSENKIIIPETVVGDISYLCPSWEQMGELTYRLARQIIDCGEKFDQVIALAKGGWTWARTFVDYLELDELSSTRIKRYKGINQSTEPVITQPIVQSLEGLNIALFDEVNDHGDTVIEAVKHAKEKGAKSVKIVTLCYKPHSKMKSDYYAFKSDDFGRSDSWVVFPHEVREFTVESAKKWHNEGATKDEVIERFDKIGLPSHQTKFFVDRIWDDL